MPAESKPIIIGTRGSALALAQANMMLDQLRAAHPREQFEIKIIKTTGDQTAKPLDQIAGLKGLWTREIEVALLDGRADLGVHSLKDLPTQLPEGLFLAVTPKRADPHDVLVTRGPRLAELPQGATIASMSLRRKSQLLALRPDLNVIDIRGNVETRLNKLKANENWGGTVLAAAGIARLKLNLSNWGLVGHMLSTDEMLPSPCQAIIGLEVRRDDHRVLDLLQALNDANTFQAALAERAFAHALDGGCRTPIAGYAEVAGSKLTLRGAVYAEDGRARFRGRIEGEADTAAALGTALAAQARAAGV